MNELSSMVVQEDTRLKTHENYCINIVIQGAEKKGKNHGEGKKRKASDINESNNTAKAQKK